MVSIFVGFSQMLASGIIASYLTYVLAIKQTLQQTLLTQRVALYRPLIHSLQSLLEQFDPGRSEELQRELNRLGRELLLYGSDDVYRTYLQAMRSVKKGAKPQQLVDFMITLRKELMGKTNVTSNDVFEIELRP